jgi:AcrR family transcriptional regulator
MKSRAARLAPVRRSYTQTARATAAEETGRRIVDAFVERLLNGWFDEITLDQVADDAGVTVQTVIRRFGGKEGLLGDAASVIGDRVNAERGEPAGDVDAMVRNLYADYEKTGDAVIRILALEPRQPAIARMTDLGRREHRRWVSTAVAGVLQALPEDRRSRVVDELVIVTDVYAWKLLRRDMGRGLADSIETTKRMVNAVIAATK